LEEKSKEKNVQVEKARNGGGGKRELKRRSRVWMGNGGGRIREDEEKKGLKGKGARGG